jgi:peptide/nickel transport system permease protein
VGKEEGVIIMAESTIANNQANKQVATLDDTKAPEARSLGKIIVSRFFRHRMAVFGLIMLTVIILYVTVGALFYSESQGNRTNLLAKEQPPSAQHFFGTDSVGRDVFIRTIYGGQISISIALVAVIISISVGTAIGIVSGYFGGIVDSILSRITEAFLAIPVLVLLLVLSSILAGSAATVNILGRDISVTVVYIVLIIGFTSWMQLSRIVRAQVLSLKEQEFIVAARAMGIDHSGVILRHLLPNLLAPIVVTATLGIGTAIISEAYLSFLGFGVQPPTASWGNILNGAQDRIESVWWIWVAPSVFIVATVLSFNFIGDGIRDALDPRAIN